MACHKNAAATAQNKIQENTVNLYKTKKLIPTLNNIEIDAIQKNNSNPKKKKQWTNIFCYLNNCRSTAVQTSQLRIRTKKQKKQQKKHIET
jgi:hypothetical protein